MKQRVITALLLTPFAIALILLAPSAWFAVIVAALTLLASWEWTRMSGLRSRPWRAVLVALCALAMAALWFHADEAAGWIVVTLGCIWWFFAVAWLKHFSFAAAPTRENAAIKLAGGALAILPAWTAVVQLHRSQASPHTWALYALMLIWAADTFAYLSGRRFGKKKLAPNISPGKTYAGVYGALIGSAVIALVGGWWLGVRGFSLAGLLVVALVAVCFSVVGDLFESLIKRHCHVKDSGALFPGHGGAYDRLDGVFAALPFFVLGKLLLGL
ncbi:MAG TPA: phosphatidate cytidylyltransferase [Rudaea sp.]|nr:phosphatidate cytidylyltransferase [Rudaea sp.]